MSSIPFWTAKSLHSLGLGTLNRGNKRMTKGRTPRHRYRKVGVRWSGLSAPEARHVCYLKAEQGGSSLWYTTKQEKVGLANLRRSGHCRGAGFRASNVWLKKVVVDFSCTRCPHPHTGQRNTWPSLWALALGKELVVPMSLRHWIFSWPRPCQQYTFAQDFTYCACSFKVPSVSHTENKIYPKTASWIT